MGTLRFKTYHCYIYIVHPMELMVILSILKTFEWFRGMTDRTARLAALDYTWQSQIQRLLWVKQSLVPNDHFMTSSVCFMIVVLRFKSLCILRRCWSFTNGGVPVSGTAVLLSSHFTCG